MLEQFLRQLKGDGRDMTTEHVANLSKNLAGLLPQGLVRRGIVSDLGELWACKLFGLTRMPERQAGYDAVDIDAKLGPRGGRYQVKSRSPEKNKFVDPLGTVGRFSSLEFDAAILVLMDSDLQVYEVWLASVDKVRANLRQGRRDITVARFKQVGKSLFQGRNMAMKQAEVGLRIAVVCWHHGDRRRLEMCLANNYCDLYGPGRSCSNWWNKLGLKIGDIVRFSVKGEVVAYGKILSEPYDLVVRKGIPPVDKSWPGAVDIGEIQWRRGGNCASSLREGSHRL
jgi:hypothetical protein